MILSNRAYTVGKVSMLMRNDQNNKFDSSVATRRQT